MNRREFLKSAAMVGICATIGAKSLENGDIEPDLARNTVKTSRDYHTAMQGEFLAELWNQEILAAYKRNLVVTGMLNV